ncbi:MAG: SLC13 family permease [Myxococcota bacterium]|nr:SLC13 family permease [Myxococcota bacterium]
MSIVLVSIILVAAIILLVTEKLPYDLTAFAIIAALVALGILSPREGLSGFANPAPLTIAFLFVISQALVRTGALDFITQQIIRYSGGKPGRLLFILLFTVGGFSSFLNNTPVVVLFISIVMSICCEYSLSPSKFLMPISFVSILAGTSTLIGTSTNIIVSDLATQHGLAPLEMFELSPLGIPTAMAGAVFLFFWGPRILRTHKEPICELKDGGRNRYLAELLVPEDSPLVGAAARDVFKKRFPDIEVFEVIRGVMVCDPHRDTVSVLPNDILLVKATAQQLSVILADKSALSLHQKVAQNSASKKKRPITVELLVQPNSDTVGQSLSDMLAGLDAHIRVLGVKRHWKHYQAEKFRDLTLAVGDLILAEVPPDHLDQIRATGDLIVIEDVHKTIVDKKKAPLALTVFALMILSAAVGIASLLQAAMMAMLILVLTGCIGLREAYRAIDIRILVLIVGTLALGLALTKSGAADLYAQTLLTPLQGTSPRLVLSGFILLTSLLSLFISNNATAALLLPIAISTAGALGVDPRPFVIGICFGASACYATPIGYQTNLLVYGPGGYKFTDYLKLGIPLNIGVWLVASIFIPLIWRF